MTEATETFLHRWRETGRLLAVGDGDAWSTLGEALRDRHNEPVRAYHGVRHVLAVLDTLAALDQERCARPALQLAAFFHDAIYAPTSDANEERSAVLAETELAHVGVDPAVIEETARLIRATDGHATDGSPEVEVFLDADLAILGAAPDVYDGYAAAIRHEYGHLADDVFRSGRSAVLQMFLDRPQLFFTAAGRNRFEAQARRNLAAEIDVLRDP